jgi:hypothetical protein
MVLYVLTSQLEHTKIIASFRLILCAFHRALSRIKLASVTQTASLVTHSIALSCCLVEHSE